MKTPRLAIALVAMAASFAAPAAFADPQREVRVSFTYKTADTAENIFSDLQRTARDACEFAGSRSLQMHTFELACVKEMVADGVAKLNRPDIAAIANGQAGIRG
jgi:UrcA family protein